MRGEESESTPPRPVTIVTSEKGIAMTRVLRVLVERARKVALFARTAWGGFRLLLDPNRLDDVFVLERGTVDTAVNDRILATIAQDPRAARAIAERHRLERVDVDRLASLPEGTLGRTFADYLRARGLDPGAIPRLDAPDDEGYVRAHLYETHDIWHVVTGFDTDVAGEIGLQAFYSAQIDGALPRWLVMGGLLHSIMKQPDDWSRRLEAIARGWNLGKRSGALFGTHWDEMWTVPLGEVRTTLRVAEA
jgi:ubiquinone biosynthesis protein Coq4